MSSGVTCLHNASHVDVAERLQSDDFFWLDLEDPTDERIRQLGEQLKLHPLTIEDQSRFGQRPKIEDYPGYLALVVQGADPATETGGPILREVHMIVSSGCVVTIHRRPLQVLADLRERYNDIADRSKVFLIYKILDELTLTFFPVLDRIDDQIDALTDEIVDNPTQDLLQQIFAMKRDLVALRRVTSGLRDVYQRNSERISQVEGLEAGDDNLYFRNLYDEIIHVGDMVDSYRDLVSGATDLYLSTVANKQGEVNKQLTIIATIFLPLSFLTGFFGQNFTFLTGHVINSNWSFWWLGLGLEALSVLGLLVLFKVRHWF
jgi:magnesium transporter